MSYDNTQYAYAVGRIRVLETQLLDHVAIDRMIGAKSAKEAFKVLHDLDYASHSTDISEVERFQEVINSDLREAKELLDKISPYPEVLHILWLHYDIHNIKTLLRAKNCHLPAKEIEENIFHMGVYSHTLLQKYIQEGAYKDKLSDQIKEIIDEAQAVYQESENIQNVDQYLDAQYFIIIKELIRKTSNDFLQEFFDIILDSTKIKTALRMKTLELNDYSQNPIFDIDAKIPKKVFAKYFSISNADDANEFFTDNLKLLPYFDAVQEGFDYFKEHHSFLKLEINLDNLLTTHLQKAKIIPLGPEAVIAYFLAKKNNAQIVRNIMVGKLNKIDEKMIKKRLRNLYV